MRICFVCLGNICRSPTAEGVMADLLRSEKITHISLDSAGTSAYHVGERPDSRSQATANKRGIQLPGTSQKFTEGMFHEYDMVIAMDRKNARDLRDLATSEEDRTKISLLRDYDPESPKGSDVPDPYYGGPSGFDDVLDICIAGCRGLLDTIQNA